MATITPAAATIRFRPPAISVPPEVDWLLLRALGPPECAGPSIGRAVLEAPALQRLPRDLLGRVHHRSSAVQLEQELGSAAFATLQQNHWRLAAQMLRHQEVARRLGAIAERWGGRLIVLKGLALHLGGHTPPGTRSAVDVDLLTDQGTAQRLQGEILASGGRSLDLPREPHHLPPLVHPMGSAIELHLQLQGVMLGGRQDHATAEDVRSAGLVTPAEGLGGACWLPHRHLLAAHLLAHAIDQHGDAPTGYPMLRLLADLQDLGFGARQPLPARVVEWIAPSVSRQEVDAVLDLLARLEAGQRASAIVGGRDDAALMLRHLLAGSLDADYQQSLKLVARWGGEDGRSSARAITHRLVRTLWLTRGQIDLIYGKPRTSAGYLLRRVGRPFDLLARTGRSAAAWMRTRRRPR